MNNYIVSRVRRGRLLAVLAAMLIVLLTVLVAGARESDFPPWQEPRLIKNILAQTKDSSVYPQAQMNGKIFFIATNQGLEGIHNELWRTDGTTAGTILLERRDDTNFAPLFVLGDKLLFLAPNPDTDFSLELWISDGTPGNAHVMGDPFPGSFNSNVDDYAVSGDYLYFTVYDNVNLTELWRTDGTVAGTIRLTGADLGLEVGMPSNPLDVNGTLFFGGNSPENNSLLLKTDGSVAGTEIVKEGIYGESYVAGGLLYIIGSDIWRSDGTTAGTYVIYTFPEGRGLEMAVGADSKVYFVSRDGNYDYELWQSSGSAATTTKIADLPGFFGRMATVGDRLFFVGYDADHADELWTSDGTPAGTKLVKDIQPGNNSSAIDYLIAADDHVFFKANGATQSELLWRSDGTTAGTVPVPLPGASADSPRAMPLAPLGNDLFFQAADDRHGWEPWMTTGGGASAVFLKDMNQIDALGSMPGGFNYVNDSLYFFTTAGLWKSDGSEAGTSLLVANVYLHREALGYPTGISGNKFYFLVHDYPNDKIELWRTDGTPGGTIHLLDAGDAAFADPVTSMANVNGRLFFAKSGRNQLWRTDGTPQGTIHVASPNPFPDAPAQIDAITGMGNTAFFVANDGVNGPALWRSDGTTNGTGMIKDIHPAADGPAPYELTVVGSTLYFVADDGVHGAEVWRSDGTAAGTALVADVRPGAESSEPVELTAFRGALYFIADDGASGREVWRASGGSAAVLKNINPTGSSAALDLTPARDWLYFSAYDGQTGLQLWKSDGTAAGTNRVTNLSYQDFGGPHGLVAVDNFVFFTTSSFASTMDNLYQSDGTAAGTVELTAAFPDFQVYNYNNLTPAPGWLFFSATHLLHGNEPFVKPVSLSQTTPALLYVGEGDAFAYYRFQLTFRPAAPVTVTFTSDDPTVEIAPGSVTIQPANWQVPVAIGVQAVDDGQPGIRAATISQTLAAAGTAFDGAVTTMPISIGWRFAYAPVVRR